ncbi:FAD-binding domain-containing protein [Pluteus cervinus]|uniref:FAD-binding domain-containing protein n=1 Tax=Pluteus cervinus TaxID=181527 RepID=A0ACD3AP35_9AGAR|nr:FAD-binding domain-containing protein [Pluteus cervinus]
MVAILSLSRTIASILALTSLSNSQDAAAATTSQPSSDPYDRITPDQWNALNASLSGRLQTAVPIAQPCFDHFDGDRQLRPNSGACAAVQANWTNTLYRVQQFGAYEQIFDERLHGRACSLNALEPTDRAAFTDQICSLGSIPPYYVSIRNAQDVQTVMKFSNQTGLPIIVKNTGHDYAGRSSAPKSIALWTKNLVGQTWHDDFVPEGCKPNAGAGKAITNQAAYTFADSHNSTVVGAAFQTVGASGGWMLGGGHGFLTGKHGLGVDSILQFKVVTPDGILRTANKCQNTDLFWALRGGGPAFGVVLESTIQAHPGYNFKVAIVIVNNITVDDQFEVFRTFAHLRPRLAREGWGGAFIPEYTPGQMAISMINPTLTDIQAADTFAPVINQVQSLNNTNGIQVAMNGFQPDASYLFIQSITVPVGLGAFIGSRLLPLKMFESDDGIDKLIPVLKSGLSRVGPGVWPPLILLMDTPLMTPDTNRETSVTPAWRNSAFQAVYGVSYQYQTTPAQEGVLMKTINQAVQDLRDLTPGSGAYLNEADILEPNHAEAFWGKQNYERLLKIKHKYDPNNMLTGWQYVGFDEKDPLFDRYHL